MTCSPCEKPPIMPRRCFFEGTKFEMGAECLGFAEPVGGRDGLTRRQKGRTSRTASVRTPNLNRQTFANDARPYLLLTQFWASPKGARKQPTRSRRPRGGP